MHNKLAYNNTSNKHLQNQCTEKYIAESNLQSYAN